MCGEKDVDVDIIPSWLALFINVRLGVGIASIACIAVRVTLVVAGLINRLPGLLLGRLACLQGLHLASYGICYAFISFCHICHKEEKEVDSPSSGSLISSSSRATALAASST